jgi:hypothetical protein
MDRNVLQNTATFHMQVSLCAIPPDSERLISSDNFFRWIIDKQAEKIDDYNYHIINIL